MTPDADPPGSPLACAVFLVVAFTLAGLAHAFWLRSWLAAPLRVPLDGRRTFRGRRVLGDNKTWGGFVVMVPAVGAAFLVLSLLRPWPIAGSGLWGLAPGAFGLLGCCVGFGFMAGELPNSFCKRQLGIAPGMAPARPLARAACLLIDRLDSIAGGLLVLTLLVPTPWLTCVWVLAVGPGMHGLFSVLLYRLGVKGRPA
jgi:CDP-archaeol synthase